MDRSRSATFWALALYFGWLLSFPLHGPVLFLLATSNNVDPGNLGLSFTLGHFGGLCLAGLIVNRRAWLSFIKVSLSLTLLASIMIVFFPIKASLLWFSMVGLGLISAHYVVAWSYPYVAQKEDRVKFMAGIILWANIVLLLFRIATLLFSESIVLILVHIPLVITFLWTTNLGYGDNAERQPIRDQSFPWKTFAMLFSLILILYLCGGFMYSSFLPVFSQYAPAPYFWEVPYLISLLILVRSGQKIISSYLVYIAVSLIGLGFIFFAALEFSFYGLWAADFLLLSGLAMLDLFLWTYLGEMGYFYGQEGKFFGFGLAANVVALFVGGVLATKIGAYYPVAIGLASCAILFAASLLTPAILHRLIADLQRNIRRLKPDVSTDTLKYPLPNAELLTDRENEIVELIVQGSTNTDIAEALFISENTVKVHIKNINRKLGVSNKFELLSVLIKAIVENDDFSA